MEANEMKLGRVLDPSDRMLVPVYQRPYVWEEDENWSPLWLSIQAAASSVLVDTRPKPVFLGAIVLEQQTTRTGSIGIRYVVDGQQRLMTLQLVLAAARDYARNEVYQADPGRLSELVAEDPARLTRLAKQLPERFNKLIQNDADLCDSKEEAFKFWPTNSDQQVYRQILMAKSRETVTEKAESDSLPAQAYLYFYDKLKNWVEDGPAASVILRVDTMHRALKGGLALVVIDLDDKDDAQDIFETLNALGTPLLSADLIKNFLLRTANKDGENMIALYGKYWRSFEDNREFWRREVGHGRFQRPRIDLFTQHFLAMQTGAEIRATELFKEFRGYISEPPRKTAVEHLSSLHEFGKVFEKFSSYPRETREGQFFYRLEQLDTTTVYPVLLAALHGLNRRKDRNELLGIMGHLESFLVRRAVCGLTTKNYNRLFLDLLQHLKRTSFAAAQVETFLLKLEGPSVVWPSEENFSQAWTTYTLYWDLVRRNLRMILESLELKKRTGLTEKVEIIEKLQVEHLMPVNWKTHWPLDPGLSEAERIQRTIERDEIVHRIGNLTLLTGRLNPSVKNGPWTKKQPAILKHSALTLNRELGEHAEWNEEEIRRRGDRLLKVAKEIWPHPESSH